MFLLCQQKNNKVRFQENIYYIVIKIGPKIRFIAMMYIQLATAVLTMYFELLTLFVDKLKIVFEKFGQAVSSML